MGKYFVEFDDIARKDLKNHYKSGNKATIKKIEKILLELILKVELTVFYLIRPLEIKALVMIQFLLKMA